MEVDTTIPRDVSQYRHTKHSYNRFKDHSRMVTPEIIKETIESGEMEPGKDGDEDDCTRFVTEWAGMSYTVVVANEPEADGVHNIVTVFHSYYDEGQCKTHIKGQA